MSWWRGLIGQVSMCFNPYHLSRALGTSQNHSQIVVEQRFGIFSFSAGPDFDNIWTTF